MISDAKTQRFAAVIVVERLDPQAIASQQEALLPAVPQGECKHPAESRDTVVAVFLIGVDDRFRVGARFEDVPARDEFRRELGVVVYLSVENDHNGAVFVEDRLFAAAEIDDTEAAVPQPHRPLAEVTEIVRTPMRDPIGHGLEQTRAYRIIRMELYNPANPAHTPCP